MLLCQIMEDDEKMMDDIIFDKEELVHNCWKLIEANFLRSIDAVGSREVSLQTISQVYTF